MENLINIALAPANFILTMLAALMVFYWLLIIFTGLDLDFANADVDADSGAIEAGEIESPSFWNSFLSFFYIGELPVMFIITIVIFCMWLINVNITAILGIENNLFGFLLYIPGLIVSMLITKVVAKPFVKLYAQFNHKGEVAIDFIGKTGKVLSPIGFDKIGQLEIQVNGDIIKVYAKSIDEQLVAFNETVIILEESPDKKYFLAQKYPQ
ncbi:hypothetical protein MATR_23590 [Marivirga tractuosa]|uniref:DUF1449 family protein n=1 Tax=Marivirga tractuosa (strain ATCC 23168 / DSM 4126 / NBRC 15989 / NCIMB 1408 / VKM B-1430 / H-43) TaxID=643867 RepID=E4TUQ6_MARTH|nr:OB-fold-containig protein [Marivirga tractuosa]ADR20034.1 hypothetical protein Ftrac_0017 [Marivirga tractuosa DSM 4126]BDD15534.1 hypothetical protein MATR_23590 [Marivirga tractuosa]